MYLLSNMLPVQILLDRSNQQSTSVETRHHWGRGRGSEEKKSHFEVAGQCLGDAEARFVIPWEIQDSSKTKPHLVSLLNAVRPRQIISEVS